MEMSARNFGNVQCLMLRNKHNVEVEVLNYGGYIRAFRVPDKDGNVKDVVLGYDTLAGSLSYCESVQDCHTKTLLISLCV